MSHFCCGRKTRCALCDFSFKNKKVGIKAEVTGDIYAGNFQNKFPTVKRFFFIGLKDSI